MDLHSKLGSLHSLCLSIADELEKELKKLEPKERHKMRQREDRKHQNKKAVAINNSQ